MGRQGFLVSSQTRSVYGARPGVTALQRSSPFFVALQSSTSFSFSAPALQYIPLLHAPTIFCLALQRSKQFKIKAPALQPIFLSFPALQLVFLSSSTLALQPFFSLRSSAPVTFSVALQRSRTPPGQAPSIHHTFYLEILTTSKPNRTCLL